MRFLILLVSLYSFGALACLNDYACGYGRKCIKPAGDYSVQGTCVTPVNEYGTQDYSYQPQGQPTTVKGCQFDTDCGIGASCMKKGGSIYGVCLK